MRLTVILFVLSLLLVPIHQPFDAAVTGIKLAAVWSEVLGFQFDRAFSVPWAPSHDGCCVAAGEISWTAFLEKKDARGVLQNVG
jgi:hypothetical protein